MQSSGLKTSLGALARIVLVLSSVMGLAWGAPMEKVVRIRLGLSDTLFDDLNENDARAAVRAWAESVAAASHMEVEGASQLMRSEEIVHAISDHLIDGFSITAPEYAKVARFVDPLIFTDGVNATTGVEYVLLVKQDSGIHDLAGLRGHSLLAYQHASMCLAPAWLETLLAGSNFDAVDRFFSRVTKSTKVAQSVLPVYFGAADACLVTRRAFDTMSELNPQLRQKLRVVAVSPKVLAAFVGVHKDSSEELKSRFREALMRMSGSPSGHQILTLFQCDRIVAVDASLLRDSVDLQTAYERLKTRRPGGSR